jgi:hypothetical protein
VSREGAGDKGKTKPPPSGGTPIWVWVVYALGFLAATIVVVSILFTAGAVFLSSGEDVSYNTSALAIVLWGGLMAVAGGLWIWRRRQGRQ